MNCEIKGTNNKSNPATSLAIIVDGKLASEEKILSTVYLPCNNNGKNKPSADTLKMYFNEVFLPKYEKMIKETKYDDFCVYTIKICINHPE